MPVGPDALVVAEDVGQAEDEVRAHPVQRVEARAQLAVQAGGQPVDDQRVGAEGGQGAAQRLAPDPDERLAAEAEAARAGVAGVLHGGQAEGVGALGEPEDRGLAGAGDQQDRPGLVVGEGAGNGDVATHPAEAVCVLGVEGDSLHGGSAGWEDEPW